MQLRGEISSYTFSHQNAASWNGAVVVMDYLEDEVPFWFNEIGVSFFSIHPAAGTTNLYLMC